MTTYGDFPGVQVTTAGGGITAVAIGDEENLVIFGEAQYARSGQFTDTLSADTADGLESSLNASIQTPEQINARSEADTLFGDGSELANAMKEALANGANIDYLYGVAVERYLQQDVESSQTGTLSNTPIYEDTDEIVWTDDSTELTVEFTYDGEPTTPTDADTVYLNPLTGQYAADTSPSVDFEVDYRSLDYKSAFEDSAVQNTVIENETGIFVALSDSDAVSSDLETEVSNMRQDYKLVNALNGAEPNDVEEVLDESEQRVRFDARYDTVGYSSANQSIDADYYFKLAPVRKDGIKDTVLGGVGGLFAGNPINDPIYNDALNGYESLEQTFSKSDADNMREEHIIPIRQAGSIRVKDNLSTSTETDWERDFWRRRITDRVILIANTVGNDIIGRINDEQTRNSAERQIEAEIRSLVDDRLLRSNADGENWFVDVYESSTEADQVNIDIGFTPYGVVKRIDATVTINT